MGTAGPADPVPPDPDAGTPWVGLSEARRRLYAPGAGAGDATKVRELEAIRDRERARLAAPGAAAPASPVPARPPVEAPARRLGRLLPTVVAVVAAFAGGLAIGAVQAPRASSPRPSASPTPPALVRSSSAGGALAVFREPQTPDDVPALTIRGDLVPGSFRLLALLPDRGVRLYGARTNGAAVCLVALSADGHTVASCGSVAGFRTSPRSIDLSVEPVLRSGASVRGEVVAAWRFDGALTAGAVP